jgi:hypothetical protein
MSVQVKGRSFNVDQHGALKLTCQAIKSVAEIEGLDALENLKELDLDLNQLKKIEGLDALGNLQRLDLHKNHIAKIEGLDALGNLQKLFLGENEIEKIEGLDALGNLKTLDLHKNQIAKIEGLDGLGKLQNLHLGGNKIEKIEGLDALSNLMALDLEGNLIEWPVGLSRDVFAQEFVLYCQQEGERARPAPQDADEDAKAVVIRNTKYFPCDAPGCPGSELLPFTCQSCGNQYCFVHRLPENHACPFSVTKKWPSPSLLFSDVLQGDIGERYPVSVPRDFVLNNMNDPDFPNLYAKFQESNGFFGKQLVACWLMANNMLKTLGSGSFSTITCQAYRVRS